VARYGPRRGGAPSLGFWWQILRSCEAEPSPEVVAVTGHPLRARRANV
jgi:hypothetical protein